MRLSCCKNKVIWGFLLKHEPHTIYIILRMTPVTFRIKVPKFKREVRILVEFSNALGDLAGHKVFTPTLGLMIEKDTTTGKHVVALTVVLDDPMSIQLCDSIRTARVKWRGLGLRCLLNLAKQL